MRWLLPGGGKRRGYSDKSSSVLSMAYMAMAFLLPGIALHVQLAPCNKPHNTSTGAVKVLRQPLDSGPRC